MVPGYKNKSKKEERKQKIRGNKGKVKEMKVKRIENKIWALISVININKYLVLNCKYILCVRFKCL